MDLNDPKMQELHPRHQHAQPLLSPCRFKKRSSSLEGVSLEAQEGQVSTQDTESKIHGASKHPTATELLTRYLSTASDTFEKFLPAARSALKKNLPTPKDAFDKHVRVFARHLRSLANRWIELPTEWIRYGAGGVGAVIALYLLFHALFGGPEDGIRVFAFGVVPTCFELLAPTNGSVDVAYYYDDQKARAGDTAFYSCDTGFTFAGDITDPVLRRTCVGDAERVDWNGSVTTCELLSPYCAHLPAPAFGSITYDPTRTFGSHAVHACDPGYTLSDDPNHLYETRECVLDTAASGVWAGDEVECKVLEPYCPLPQAPANGKVTQTGLELGDTATFSCDYGFSISSANSMSVRVCEPGSARVGQWSGLQPQCTQPFDNLPFAAAYVVNLPSRTERVMANLATVGIHPISVPAVHRSHLNRHELEGSGVLVPDSALKMGEIACHMSHTKALEAFLESGYKTAIIFEDDIAVPDAKVVDDMTYIAERLPKDWDIFNMMRCSDDCSRQEVVEDGLNLVRCYKPHCTSSVAFTRRAAQTILKLSPKPMASSYGDVVANLVSDGKLVAYCAHSPRLFEQDTMRVPSEIEESPGPVPLPGQCYTLPPDTPKRMTPVELSVHVAEE